MNTQNNTNAKPAGQSPSCALLTGSGLTTREVTDGLEYIATSPAPEYGGFHPNTVRIATGALEEIVRLRRLLGNAADELDNYIADCENYEAPEEVESLRKLAAECHENCAPNTEARQRGQ